MNETMSTTMSESKSTNYPQGTVDPNGTSLDLQGPATDGVGLDGVGSAPNDKYEKLNRLSPLIITVPRLQQP